ncbi:MAG: C40 family peptidase [Reichenbachiella sp.]
MKHFFFILIGVFFLSTINVSAQNKKKKKSIKAVIQNAEYYKGTPYLYGGTSKKGIDCSALIQNSFSKAGYKIPRTSKEQSKHGKKVSWGSVRPGDLVFFKFKKKGEKWYHSGLITKVSGENIYFVHASSSRGVVESNLKSDYYKDNVKTFRRVI